jgi:hypothetical protein
MTILSIVLSPVTLDYSSAGMIGTVSTPLLVWDMTWRVEWILHSTGGNWGQPVEELVPMAYDTGRLNECSFSHLLEQESIYQAREMSTDTAEDNVRRERRETILRAAAKVFAQFGYFRAKVSDVARAAGVADGTVYLYSKVVAKFLFGVLDGMATNWVLSRKSNSLSSMIDPVLDLFLNGVNERHA